METNFNPAGDIMAELYLEEGGRGWRLEGGRGEKGVLAKKKGTPGGRVVRLVRVMGDYSCKSS